MVTTALAVLKNSPRSLPSEPTYRVGTLAPVVLPLVTGSALYDSRIPLVAPVLNHIPTDCAPVPFIMLAGICRYDDVPLSDAAVVSVNGPGPPRVTVLYVAVRPLISLVAPDPAGSLSRQ